jgi:hypothetical protein
LTISDWNEDVKSNACGMHKVLGLRVIQTQ